MRSASTEKSLVNTSTQCAIHIAPTTNAIPMSGCKSNSKNIVRNSPVAIPIPGKDFFIRPSENIHAAITAKLGLINSEGCRENPQNLNQRVAPLISGPTKSTAIISIKVNNKIIEDNLRIPRRLSIEVIKIVETPTIKNIKCLSTK